METCRVEGDLVTGETEQRIELELAADHHAPEKAREAVDRLTSSLPGDVGFRARLAASELVANSATHAAEESEGLIRVTLVRTELTIRIEVRDAGKPFAPLRPVPPPEATSGRGLLLVEALADRWGSDHRDGNLVWFEIDRPSNGIDYDAIRPAAAAERAGPRVLDDSPDGQSESVAELAASLLARAAAYVRQGWCQGNDARDSAGRPVRPWDQAAAHWSLLGALIAVIDGPRAIADANLPPAPLAVAMAALADLIDDASLSGWNDAPSRNQLEVAAVLETAQLMLRLGRVQI